MLQDYDTSFSRVYFSRPRLFSSPSLFSPVPTFFSSVVARSSSLYRLSFDMLPGAGSCSLQLSYLLISTVNAQSLVALSEDISTNVTKNRSGYLAINRTWMDFFMSVNLSGFDLRSYCNIAKRRQIATTSSVAVSSLSICKAVGVTIYHSINGYTNYNRVNIDISKINLGMKDTKAVWGCLSSIRKR
ncbi:hypothetical protein TNCV_86991 [Trichonephila clavipes]|nr:hypothetical protein TNCV_86991 [Trichonephila clavipes]